MSRIHLTFEQVKEKNFSETNIFANLSYDYFTV